MFQSKVVQKIKTHILCSKIPTPHPENRAVYEIMWENPLEQGRPQMKIERTRITCWITEATDTHSEYVTRIAIHGYSVYAKAPRSYGTHCGGCLAAQSFPPI